MARQHRTRTEIAGFSYFDPNTRQWIYLPQIKLEAHASIISSTSRTTLVQAFVNPSIEWISELRYSFPLYDGASVVGFTCTIGDRVVNGVVKEKQNAREVYQQAISRGQTAGLLEQLPESSDIFTTTIGNVPAGAEINVKITYLGELKHDAQVDGTRFMIPTTIAPRYGSYPGELAQFVASPSDGGMRITVDAEVPDGSHISSIQSPSHPLTVTLGRTSVAPDAESSFQRASATLTLRTAELEKDVIVLVKATNTGEPLAILEQHPDMPNQQALMVTLVPKFALPAEKPEVVFVCDRSGSMEGKITNLQSALHLFVKSLSIGTKFNICSFGSRSTFLWARSRTYDQSSVDEAMKHIDTFAADYGGTKMYRPIEETFKRRYKDMNLEVFLITDGEIWDQERLINMVNRHVAESNGAIRVFTLGIGAGASTSLIEGVARAGNGFSQTVSDTEEMGTKVVRMLKGATFPHIKDYSLEIKYEETYEPDADDSMVIDNDAWANDRSVATPSTIAEEQTMAPISLFNTSMDIDSEISAVAGTTAGNRYSHLPDITPPKTLQAPFFIPPLFPFSRTSVYILLSREMTPQKTPKSVILRGTSTYGPLELAIPITALETKGQTIHQLAAKKYVGDLEEGRGWIFHAKDNRDEKLFSKKYDGMFQDMVEREAVRVGVTYQVGGKWCSFVAVETSVLDNGTEGGEKEGSTINQSGERRSARLAHRGAHAHSLQPSQSQGTAKPTAASAYRTPNVQGSFGGISPIFPPGMTSEQRFAMASGRQVTTSPVSRMSGPIGSLSRGTTPEQRFTMASSRPQGLPSTSPSAPVSVAAALAPSAVVDDELLAMYKNEMEAAACMPLVDEDEDDDLGFAVATAVVLPKPQTPLQKLQRIIAFQSFAGFWALSDDIMTLMEWEWKIIARAGSSIPASVVADKRDFILTACIVSWIRREMDEQKDIWELLVEKAAAWMEDQVGEHIARKTMEKAAQLV